MRAVVIIPAFNEERSIGLVLESIPKNFKSNVIVCDNGSTDNTASVAKDYGAAVISVTRKGYGSACLSGLKEAQKLKPDVVIFLDGDYSDYPEDMTIIVNSLVEKNLDLVIGSRVNLAEPEALFPQARFGNWLATRLLKARFGYQFSDLGPFRAIRADALQKLNMKDTNFGWTVEMQIKSLKMNLKVAEVQVRYRKRIGKSKITGTIRGTIRAGIKILWLIFKHSFNFQIPSRSSYEIKKKFT